MTVERELLKTYCDNRRSMRFMKEDIDFSPLFMPRVQAIYSMSFFAGRSNKESRFVCTGCYGLDCVCE